MQSEGPYQTQMDPEPIIIDNSGVVSDTAPDQVNGYDWVEDQILADNLADGMAALRVEPSCAGYLGE